MKKLSCVLLALLLSRIFFAQNIQLNQIGFYPESYKLAIVPASADGTFQLIDVSSKQIAYTGNLGDEKFWVPANASVKIADFSEFETEGTYYIEAGAETSPEFDISNTIFEEPAKGLARAFFYWRSSAAIEAPYSVHQGTDFSRALGHPDNAVVIDQTAASENRPAGFAFDCSQGWYDAGDYGKYVVTGALSAYYLLAAYENYPVFSSVVDLNIPESANQTPDILDEAKWELDWLLKMQDPDDGGVYFQITTSSWAGMGSSPADDTGTRYAYKKTSPSTLDFAAVMATAYRVFKDFETEYPGYADRCLQASKSAWDWAQANPDVYYGSAGGTGQYEDNNGEASFHDEMAWAANELFIATGEPEYYTATDFLNPEYCELEEPSWQKLSGLGLFSLMNNFDELDAAADKPAIEERFMSYADSLWNIWDESGYKVMTDRYWWGINAIVATQGVIFLVAYQHTNDDKYLKAAISQLDYIYGRNPTGYSYVTWYGDKTPQHPHDRRSLSDGIDAPLPGYIVGGAFDPCLNCEGVATAYEDSDANFEKNEIAINFNAPAVYLIYGIASALKYNGAYILSAATNTVDDSKLFIQLSSPLDETSFNSISGFELTMGGASVAITGFSLKNSNKTIVLEIANAITPVSKNILLSYNGTEILAIDGKPLHSISELQVANNLPGAPLQLQSASINPETNRLSLLFDKTIAQTGQDSEFSFTINGFESVLEGISFSDKTVTLIIPSGITGTDILHLSYTGTGIIADDTGVLLPFGSLAIENTFTDSGVKQFGFRDDMDDGSYEGRWAPGGMITLKESNDILTVHCNGQGGYDHLIGTFTPVDISNNPSIEIRLKAPTDLSLRIDLGSFDGTQIVYTNTNAVSVPLTGGEFETLIFEYTDFEGSWPAGMVEPENISQVNIMFNAGGGYGEDVEIDYIQIGDKPLSQDSRLQSLSIDAPYAFTADFTENIFTYTVLIEEGTAEVPSITATAKHPSAKVVIEAASNSSESTLITVTAEDGISKSQYKVIYKEIGSELTQQLFLKAGWNLVSFYALPDNTSPEAIFADISSELICIKTSDYFYKPDNDPLFNTLEELAIGPAYLIQMNSAQTISITGNKSEQGSISLSKGWNLIGNPYPDRVAPEDFFSAISDKLIIVKNFDKSYIPGQFSSLVSLNSGEGYFIQLSDACELYYSE